MRQSRVGQRHIQLEKAHVPRSSAGLIGDKGLGGGGQNTPKKIGGASQALARAPFTWPPRPFFSDFRARRDTLCRQPSAPPLRSIPTADWDSPGKRRRAI